ncbi:MAG: TrkH family potassium uptake protein, partial [Chroococcales cyanobacterium]
MSPYFKTILRDTGLFLHVPGLMAIVSIIVAIAFAEYYAIIPFIVTAVVSLTLGQLLFRYFYKAEQARTPDAMITAALSWGLIPLLGTIPFLMIASQVDTLPDTSVTLLNFQDPWNAIFESFSGFTSTGLSMALHPSELPRSLQWWRSFIEWIGGVGVIVLVLSLLQPSTDPYQLYSAEGRNQRIALTVQKTVRNIWWIYLLYTIASIMLLRIAGMPWWDAVNHGLTGISTGGFSIRDGSIGAYSPPIQMAVIPIMIAGAISFPMHYILLTKREVSSLWKDDQHRAFGIVLIIGIFLLLLVNYLQQAEFFWLDSIFQWVSA